MVPPVLLLAALALTPSLAHAVIHHVTTTGSPAGNGSIASPYDLATGLSVMAPGDSVYIANGSYTWTESASGLIPIQNSCMIEGDFDPGTWTKVLSPRTTITIEPDLHVFSGVSAYYVGIDASSRSNFTVRDLALFVLPGGALGTYAHRGISVYGVHLASCSGYSFSHVSIITGAASGGENGAAGTNGRGGLPGRAGGTAGNSGLSPCGLGGAGGAGGDNDSTVRTVGCNLDGMDGSSATLLRMGGSGGAGGAGDTIMPTFPHSFAGDGGDGGLGGPGGVFPQGGAGGEENCIAAIAGLNGENGTPGHNGADFGSRPRPPITASQRSDYFGAAGSASGGDGTGGSGGGGGGGGGGTYWWDRNCHPPATGTSLDGAGGGGGGGGGEGGTGGSAGYGGGSSYAVYLVSNGANTSFSCSSFAPGAAGIGGDGAMGGAGGTAGAGGDGGSGTPSSGAGGTGGTGGRGGDGGDGQAGQNGESVSVLTQSGTEPTITGDACGLLAVGDDRSPSFALHASQPNPTASFTRIAYDLPREANVTLRVFDAQGRAVRLLASGEDSPGRKGVRWDLKDDQGVRVRAGIYFYQLRADRFEALQRVIVLD